MLTVHDDHAARLLRMAPLKVVPAMGEELEFGAKSIVEDAQFSIKDGAISGPGHIASLPGEPPNADTHDLDLSIHVGDVIDTPGTVQTSVIVDSDHAMLELGYANVEERPYLRPATRRAAPDVIDALHKRYREVVGI